VRYYGGAGIEGAKNFQFAYLKFYWAVVFGKTTAPERDLLLAYLDYTDGEGVSHPGDELLSRKIHQDERSVRRKRAALVAKGFLEKSYAGGGRHRCAHWRLVLPIGLDGFEVGTLFNQERDPPPADLPMAARPPETRAPQTRVSEKNPDNPGTETRTNDPQKPGSVEPPEEVIEEVTEAAAAPRAPTVERPTPPAQSPAAASAYPPAPAAAECQGLFSQVLAAVPDEKFAAWAVRAHPAHAVKTALAVFAQKRSRETIRNPGGFFRTLLTEGCTAPAPRQTLGYQRISAAAKTALPGRVFALAPPPPANDASPGDPWAMILASRQQTAKRDVCVTVLELSKNAPVPPAPLPSPAIGDAAAPPAPSRGDPTGPAPAPSPT
jgi:hypothetical protein